MLTPPLFKKCIAEFLGAFLIIFGGCGAIAVNQISQGAVTHVGVALTFGLIVMTMIYALGHISGAHFNPAVSIAFCFKRHFPAKELLPYIISQCLGAISASLMHRFLFLPCFLKSFPDGTFQYGMTLPCDGIFMTAFIIEGILTFFLMLVIMAVATDFRAVGQMAGIAIGGAVALAALFAGPICGASMNPARSLGPALISGEFQHFAAYVAGPILGALAAAFIYDFIRCSPGDKEQVKGCC